MSMDTHLKDICFKDTRLRIPPEIEAGHTSQGHALLGCTSLGTSIKRGRTCVSGTYVLFGDEACLRTTGDERLGTV